MNETEGLDLLSCLWMILMGIVGLCMLAPFVIGSPNPKSKPELAPPGPLSFDGIPEKDPELSNEAQGLYNKFEVYRRDGSSELGGKHEGCDYFVLDLSHDPYAAETLWYYAGACAQSHPLLSQDLKDRVRGHYNQLDEEDKV